MVPIVHKLFSAGLAPSTSKVYASGQKQYLIFCDSAKLSPFPASENTLMLFVAFLHSKSLAPGTIKGYLAAMRFHQIGGGQSDPKICQIPQLEYVIKGIKRSSPAGSRCRLPVTPAILISLKRECKRAKILTRQLFFGLLPVCVFWVLEIGRSGDSFGDGI